MFCMDSKNAPFTLGDPSLYIHNEECVTGNYFVLNLNEGYVYPIDSSNCTEEFCSSNTIIVATKNIFSAGVDCSGASSHGTEICPE